jgi:hypothetical protein
MEASKSITRHLEKISYLDIDPMLKQLQVTLEARHNILPDVSKELLAFSQKIVDYTNEWCPGIPKSVGYDHRTSTTPDDIYIVNCHELHPVPGKIILPSIEENTLTRPQHASLSPVCPPYRPIYAVRHY